MGEKPSPFGEDFSSINKKSEYRNPKQIQKLNVTNEQRHGELSA
jgi:hypothetical protein